MNGSTGRWLAGGAAGLVLAGAVAFLLLNRGSGLPGASLSPSGSSPPEATPSPTLNQELLNQRLTVLLIGTDSNEPRRARGAGVNADTLMVASVSADQSQVTLVSLPRDTVGVPLPGGGAWEGKVNGIYSLESVETLVGAVEELFQVPIDAYAEIDMDDMAAVIDAAGGVRVSPPQPMRDPIVRLDIPAGRQLLDGRTAMAYMRTRADSDYARSERQQEVLQKIVRQLLSPEADVDFADLASGLASFETDLPLDDLPTLVEIARRARNADVTGEVLGPPDFILFEGDRGDGRGYIIEPDIDAIRDFVAQHIGDE